MKIATAAYPLDFLSSWAHYEDKLHAWIDEAASHGADLLVFPEWSAVELATLAGAEVAGDLELSLHAISDALPDAYALHAHLARQFGVHILGGSALSFHAPASKSGRPVNRARFFTPAGASATQDKQIMTRFEAETWNVVPGAPLQLFDTTLGRIGVLICYDGEFPLLGRALCDAEVLLIPSVTETRHGHSRVRIGAQARALENQCVTAVAALVGEARWSPAVDLSIGTGGVFGPPDRGFPDTGIFAVGELNTAGWTYAEVDLAKVAEVRADGGVLNRRDWTFQKGRSKRASVTVLR